jgi:hypothetical protein
MLWEIHLDSGFSETSGVPTGAFAYAALHADGIFWTALNQGVHFLTRDFADAGDFPAPDDAGTRTLTGDCRTVFASPPGRPLFVLDASSATWTTLGTNTFGDVYSVAIDEDFVYLGEANLGGLWRVRKTTGAAERIASTVGVWGIAVDDDAVYFGVHDKSGPYRGTIYRIAK